MAARKKKLLVVPNEKAPPKWETPEIVKGQLRIEDLAPYTIFTIDWNDGVETHLCMPNQHEYKAMVHTIMLVDKQGSDCNKTSTIPAYVAWDYKIQEVKDAVLKIEVADGKMVHKLSVKKKIKEIEADKQIA